MPFFQQSQVKRRDLAVSQLSTICTAPPGSTPDQPMPLLPIIPPLAVVSALEHFRQRGNAVPFGGLDDDDAALRA